MFTEVMKLLVINAIDFRNFPVFPTNIMEKYCNTFTQQFVIIMGGDIWILANRSPFRHDILTMNLSPFVFVQPN